MLGRFVGVRSEDVAGHLGALAPAATASNNFIRRTDRPDATTQIAGSIEAVAPTPAPASVNRMWFEPSELSVVETYK